MLLNQVAELLKQRIGLDIESIGHHALERAMRQRIQQGGAGTEAAYWQQLSGSPAEQQALIEAVVVGETWFFRYPASFAALGRLALQRLPQREGGRLRILSLPCASGEEPYSIAMSLLDTGLLPGQFLIDAIDVSEQALTLARQAVYGQNAFRTPSPDFRSRYFETAGDGFRLLPTVRTSVNLRTGNLLQPGLLATEPPYDFVFCRNLLIYFDRPTQQQALEQLIRLVSPDGALFVGPAEANLCTTAALRPLNIPQAFVFRRDTTGPATPAPAGGARRSPRQPAASAPKPPPPRPRAPQPVRAAPAATAPVADNIDLDQVIALADRGCRDEALVLVRQLQQQRSPSAELYYWQALLEESAGNAPMARELYRKALYLQPDHAAALMQLATLLASSGDQAGARRLQQRASRATSSDKGPPHAR